MSAVIKARLLVALRLIDTTTGRDVEEMDIKFARDGEALQPMYKGDGFWVLLGDEREDFTVHIAARGFDEADVPILYETLDPNLPTRDVFLMPSEKNRKGGTVVTIHGTLPGLDSIETVASGRPICLYHSVMEKRGVISISLLPVQPGGRVNIAENMRHALLSEDGMRYDVFEITAGQTQTQFVLKDRIETEHKVNDRVCRIIYGRAGPDGRFELKVRGDGSTLPYLLHFTVGEEEYFRPIDMAVENGEIDLLKDAQKVYPMTGKETTEDE